MFRHALDQSSVTSSQYARWIKWLNANLQYDPFQAALAYRLTGNLTYRAAALAGCDADYAKEVAAVAAGERPAIATDSYYGILDVIRRYVYTMAWCRPSAAQITAYTQLCSDAIANLCTRTIAQESFFGKLMVPHWDGWCWNPNQNWGDNYADRDLCAVVMWALYSQDLNLLSLLKNKYWPGCVAYHKKLAGGGSTEGTNYGLYLKSICEAYSTWNLNGLTPDYSLQTTHCHDSQRYWVHVTCPGSKFLAPIGDQSRVSTAPVYDYQRDLLLKALPLNPPDSAQVDAKWWLTSVLPAMTRPENCYLDLWPIVSPPYARPLSTFYSAPGVGNYFVRQDWTPGSAYLFAIAGLQDEGHLGHEQGDFGLWRNGWQTVTQNIHSKSGIEEATIYRNVVLFKDPNGKVVEQVPCDIVPPAPIINGNLYILGPVDLTPAYGKTGISMKRTWTFDMTTGAARIQDTEIKMPAGYTAFFQLQTPTQPTISGDVLAVGGMTGSGFTGGLVVQWTGANDPSGWRVLVPILGGASDVTLQV